MVHPARGWMSKAACAEEGPGWLDKPTRAQVDDCLDCPVRLHCLLYAVDTAATDVVYGGIKLRHQPLRKVD